MVPLLFDAYGLPVPEVATDGLFPDGNELALFKGIVTPTPRPLPAPR